MSDSREQFASMLGVDRKKLERRARTIASLEDLAVRCLTGAVIALARDALDENFEWTSASDLAVDLAVAIRSRVVRVTADMADEELALLAAHLRAEASAN